MKFEINRFKNDFRDWWLRYLLRNCTHVNIIVCHDSDVIVGTIASQITSCTSVYSTVYSGADQRKRQSSVSLTLFTGDR